MAAYYLLSTGEFVHSDDVAEDIYHLIKDKVLGEMKKRGVSREDAFSALHRITRELEQEHASKS